MAERRPNVLFLFSDEHDPRHMGVSGSPLAQTPNMDRLARRGTRFVNAYTPSPICVPARASLATGLAVHDIGYWDNAIAYDGRVQGWGHALQANGHRVESIGKLHYTDVDAPSGFSAQHLAMHIWEGIGQVWGCVRDPLPEQGRKDRVMLKNIGPGWSNYNQFDADVADSAVDWLRERAASPDDKPWTLFVGMVAPHFPLVAPQEFFDLYPLDALEHSKLLPADGFAHHPWIARREEFIGEEKHFAGQPQRRKLAIAGYLALCTFIDRKVGMIIDALEQSGLADDTIVIYSSDHGDNLGQRGLWGKSNMYLESSAVPMIIAGPDVPSGSINYTPVNLVDLHATFLDAAGVADVDDGHLRSSKSLLDMLNNSDHERITLSQYHAVGAPTGAFLVANARWKYHYYVDYPPELFDLRFDPQETTNLATDPAHAESMRFMHAALVRELGGRTPEQVDRMAKDDQNALVDKFGGPLQAMTEGTPAATPVPGKGHE
jgi:choline-sulfatase